MYKLRMENTGLKEVLFILYKQGKKKTGSRQHTEKFINKISQQGVRLWNCREQSYDNCANMVGKYKVKSSNPVTE